MADQPKYDINVQDYLDATAPGFKFAGFQDGKPIAEDDKGQIADIDPAQILSSNRLDPKHLGSVTYNRPEDALPESPITFEDRLKLSFSDPKQKIEYLKANYGEVYQDENRGLLVKSQGAWHEVDPSFFGNGDMGRFMAGIIKANNALMPDLPDVRHEKNKTRRNQGILEGAKEIASNLGDAASGLGSAAAEVVKGAFGAAKNTLNGTNIQDFAGDVADIPSDAVNAALTASGALVAGAPGAAGGAGLATVLNAKIGQRLGTNAQTPMEVAGDATLNAALSGGAQFLAAAARPETDAILKGAGVGEVGGPKALIEGLKSFQKSTTDKAKKSYAYMVQALTGRDEEATMALMNHAQPVVKRIGEHLAESGGGIEGTKNAIRLANGNKRKLFTKLANDISDAQTDQWVNNSRKLVNSAGVKDFKLVGQEVEAGLGAVLESANVGTIVRESVNTGAKSAGSKATKETTKALQKNLKERAAVAAQLAAAKKSAQSRLRSLGGIGNDFDDEALTGLKATIAKAEERAVQLADESAGLRATLAESQAGKTAQVQGKSVFKPFEGAGRVETGQGVSNLERQFHGQIQGMVDEVAGLTAKGQVTGKRAANLLIDYRKKLSGLARGIAEEAGGWHTPKGATAAKLLDGIDGLLTKFAEKGGIADDWATLINSHKGSATAVKEMRKALGDETGKEIDRLLKRILSKTGANEPTKDLYETAVKLLGGKADHQIQQIAIEHGAESFLTLKPSISGLKAFGLGGIAFGTHSPVGWAAAGALATGSSPRLAAKGAAMLSATERSMSQRSAKVYRLLEGLNPQARGMFLRSPEAMDAITRSVLNSVGQEAVLMEQAHAEIEKASKGGQPQ